VKFRSLICLTLVQTSPVLDIGHPVFTVKIDIYVNMCLHDSLITWHDNSN